MKRKAAKKTEERVAWVFRCPRCDEQRMDWLVWVADDKVQCLNCKAVYTP